MQNRNGKVAAGRGAWGRKTDKPEHVFQMCDQFGGNTMQYLG